MSPFWIVFHAALVPVTGFTVWYFYPRKTAAKNFTRLYANALKLGVGKKEALTDALKHLQTTLAPFDQLTNAEIDAIVQSFSDLNEPAKALKPLLEHVTQIKSVQPLKDQTHLTNWKMIWKTKMEA